MYVEIGPYGVFNGETLPTKDLGGNDHYRVVSTAAKVWNKHTVIMVDLDAPYPENAYKAPYLHLLTINGYDGGKETVVRYIPPSPPVDSKPHRYKIYLFQQTHDIPSPTIDTREQFDVHDFMQYEARQGRSLILEDTCTFYGDARLGDLSASPTTKNVFSEYYESDKLSEEDLQVLADIYGIPDAFTLSSPEIKAKINKILSHKN